VKIRGGVAEIFTPVVEALLGRSGSNPTGSEPDHRVLLLWQMQRVYNPPQAARDVTARPTDPGGWNRVNKGLLDLRRTSSINKLHVAYV